MVNRLSIRLTDLLMKNKVGAEDQYDWYVYGFELLLGKLLSYSSLLAIALLLGQPGMFVVYFAFFFPLRGYTGGYHAKSNWACALYSVLFFTACLLVARHLPAGYSVWMLGVLPVCIGVVYRYAPINHPDLKLNSAEIAQSRGMARRVVVAEAVVILGMWLLGCRESVVMASLALAIGAGTVLFAKAVGQEIPPEK